MQQTESLDVIEARLHNPRMSPLATGLLVGGIAAAGTAAGYFLFGKPKKKKTGTGLTGSFAGWNYRTSKTNGQYKLEVQSPDGAWEQADTSEQAYTVEDVQTVISALVLVPVGQTPREVRLRPGQEVDLNTFVVSAPEEPTTTNAAVATASMFSDENRGNQTFLRIRATGLGVAIVTIPGQQKQALVRVVA